MKHFNNLQSLVWDDEYEVSLGAAEFGSAPKEEKPGKWAHVCEQDYSPLSQTKVFGAKNVTFYFVKYRPNTTLGLGFAKLFVLEHSSRKGEHVFPRMKEMWKMLHDFNKPGGKARKQLSKWYGVGAEEGSCSVAPDGEIRTAFGTPKVSEATYLTYQLMELYEDWRRFPNVKDYDLVQKLKGALSDVYAMRMNAEEYQREIDDTRERIKEFQEHIADTEKRMTEMYETAADAMNLLEENGVEVDLNKPLDMEGPLKGSMFLSPDMYTIKYDPGQLITINPNYPGDSICYSKASE